MPSPFHLIVIKLHVALLLECSTLPWQPWLYYYNVTLDISNLGRVPGRGLVSVFHCNFTLDISNLGRVPGRGLVSVYHYNVTVDISNLGRSPGVDLCQCFTVILPWISRT